MRQILNEIVAMFAKINTKIEGEEAADEVNIGELIDISIGSIINSILFGYRFDEVISMYFLGHELILKSF